MIKQTSILFLLSCYIIQATDSLEAKFEAQLQDFIQRQLEADKSDQAKHTQSKKITLSPEEHALIQDVFTYLPEQNKELAKEVEKQKQEKKELALLLPVAAATGAVFVTVTRRRATDRTVDNSKKLLAQVVPDLINSCMKAFRLNKTIAHTKVNNLQFELNTQQLVTALCQTLLSYNMIDSAPNHLSSLLAGEITRVPKSELQQYIKNEKSIPNDLLNHVRELSRLMNNYTEGLKNVEVKDQYALSKEDIFRLALVKTAQTIIQSSIQVVDDRAVELPGGTVVLRESQLIEAGCNTTAEIVGRLFALSNIESPKSKIENSSVSPEAIAHEFAKNVSTEIGYNALVKLAHIIAEKTDTQNYVEEILPKDCQPKNKAAHVVKQVICGGLTVSALYASCAITDMCNMDIDFGKHLATTCG